MHSDLSLDLGPLTGELVVFGGPYSNVQAVQALLSVAGTRRMICTGDVVAYCGAPVETVGLIRASGTAVVAGNCEQQLGAYALDCGCGFEDGTACDLLSAGWYAFANAQVSAEHRTWMAELPNMISFSHAGKRYAVIHGGLSDVSRFLWSVSANDAFHQEIALIEAKVGPVDVVLAGHSGIGFIRTIGRHTWINAGVIGMPPHDGLQTTEYLWIDAGGQAQLKRLDYDAQSAAADMVAAGLVQGYHTSLETGYWPSEDALPDQLSVPSSLRASG